MNKETIKKHLEKGGRILFMGREYRGQHALLVRDNSGRFAPSYFEHNQIYQHPESVEILKDLPGMPHLAPEPNYPRERTERRPMRQYRPMIGT